MQWLTGGGGGGGLQGPAVSCSLPADSQLPSWKGCYRIPGMCLELKRKIPKIASINTLGQGWGGTLSLAHSWPRTKACFPG